MAKYRKIDCRIWNDEKFRELYDESKLLFFLLLTHPHMTALGAMRGSPQSLASDLGWFEKSLREALAKPFSNGMIKLDEEACFIWLPNFLKYNQPENPNVIKAWQYAFDMLPECDLKYQLYQHVKEYMEGYSQSFRDAFETLSKELAKPFRKPEPEPEPEPEQDNISAFADRWNKIEGVRKIKEMSKERIKHLNARIREGNWQYEDALKKFPLKCFQESEWKPNIDWFIKPGTVNSILEGKYDFVPKNNNGNKTKGAAEHNEELRQRLLGEINAEQ
jgi:hypothetical protein